MNTKELDASKLDSGFSTIEASAIKRVVRENWESRLNEKGTGLDILNEHAAFMTREFDALDYETLCMQNIAARAKHMSRGELLEYTRAIEALAVGYKARFGAEFGMLLVAGMALVSRDAKSAKRHLDYFLNHLSESESAYGKAIDKEIRRLERLDSRMKSRNSGILRFLRKKEIGRLSSRIGAGRERITKLGRKKDTFAKLAAETRARAEPRRTAKR